MSALTPDQYNFLASPLHPGRVQKANGHSHLAAWDIRRHLIRCFGFASWTVETLHLDLVRELEHPPESVKYANGGTNNRVIWTVVYRAEVRLTLLSEDGDELAHYDDAAAGDAVNQPSLGDAHDLAMKTALSQALKRCAVNLGDQYGLSLYKAGEAGASVMRTLTAPADSAAAEVSEPAEGDGKRRRPTGTGRLFALLGEAGYKDKGDRIAIYRAVTGREEIASTNDLTPFEVAQICRSVEAALAEEHTETPA
jgi:hypothetical protein